MVTGTVYPFGYLASICTFLHAFELSYINGTALIFPHNKIELSLIEKFSSFYQMRRCLVTVVTVSLLDVLFTPKSQFTGYSVVKRLIAELTFGNL